MGAKAAAAWIALAMLAACAAPVPQGDGAEEAAFKPDYLGIRTALLEDELVRFSVAMKGARSESDVEAYARCAAAQYALIRGAGFARHVRTTMTKSAGIWRGDAVYVISGSLPRGNLTIDAEVALGDCAENAIPTV